MRCYPFVLHDHCWLSRPKILVPKKSQPWNSLLPPSLLLSSPLASWPNLRLSSLRECLSSSSELTVWMCGVTITEQVNRTPASAQDPFVWRLVIRMSTTALNIARLSWGKVLNPRVSYFSAEKTMESDQLEGRQKVENCTLASSKDFQKCGGSLRYRIMYGVFVIQIFYSLPSFHWHWQQFRVTELVNIYLGLTCHSKRLSPVEFMRCNVSESVRT